MKKLIIIFICFFAVSAQATTLQDYLNQGYTKHDIEKSFIEVTRAFMNVQVPDGLGFPFSEWCNPPGQNCVQVQWKDYCAGGWYNHEEEELVLITLDRCGYPDGQNRKYPPTEEDINRYLLYFGGLEDNAIYPKNPGMARKQEYYTP